eukprot:TRINITY_DN3576_c0_g2_i2.p1 TRINITY_DN3576_c0_g2~~TRINITY_DN3576_c0_g2_i2.p1  ORF type:complete len:496 (+),score=119.61 TRINITY_DN3576_c0_g2_i2:105-1592(+)
MRKRQSPTTSQMGLPSRRRKTDDREEASVDDDEATTGDEQASEGGQQEGVEAAGARAAQFAGEGSAEATPDLEENADAAEEEDAAVAPRRRRGTGGRGKGARAGRGRAASAVAIGSETPDAVKQFRQSAAAAVGAGGVSATMEDDGELQIHDESKYSHASQAKRRKINIEFIEDKSRRHITFSKRKAGIMKKAYELSTLTGTQVLLLVASETGHVYTFATPKLQPIISKPEGKQLIQGCLNAQDPLPAGTEEGGAAEASAQPPPPPPQRSPVGGSDQVKRTSSGAGQSLHPRVVKQEPQAGMGSLSLSGLGGLGGLGNLSALLPGAATTVPGSSSASAATNSAVANAARLLGLGSSSPHSQDGKSSPGPLSGNSWSAGLPTQQMLEQSLMPDFSVLQQSGLANHPLSYLVTTPYLKYAQLFAQANKQLNAASGGNGVGLNLTQGTNNPLSQALAGAEASAGNTSTPTATQASLLQQFGLSTVLPPVTGDHAPKSQ